MGIRDRPGAGGQPRGSFTFNGGLGNDRLIGTPPNQVHCSNPLVPFSQPGPYYCAQWGTSQATGVVSGVAALLFSLNPSLTAAEVRAILEDTAMPLALRVPS